MFNITLYSMLYKSLQFSQYEYSTRLITDSVGAARYTCDLYSNLIDLISNRCKLYGCCVMHVQTHKQIMPVANVVYNLVLI